MFDFNKATQNGSQLSSTAIGTQAAALGPLGTVGNQTNGSLVSDDVTAGTGVKPVGGVQPGGGGFFRNAKGGFNTDNIGLALGGIQTLGSLWNSYQQNKIAKEQLSLARKTFQTNLENNTQTYNTALEDRIRARHNTEGRSSQETDAYLSENRL